MAISNTLAIRLQSITQQFDRGMQRSTDKVRQFAQQNRTLGDVMRNLIETVAKTNPALAAMATVLVAVVAGVAALAAKLGNAANDLANFAKATGTSTSFLSKADFAAKQFGLSLDSLSDESPHMFFPKEIMPK